MEAWSWSYIPAILMVDVVKQKQHVHGGAYMRAIYLTSKVIYFGDSPWLYHIHFPVRSWELQTSHVKIVTTFRCTNQLNSMRFAARENTKTTDDFQKHTLSISWPDLPNFLDNSTQTTQKRTARTNISTVLFRSVYTHTYIYIWKPLLLVDSRIQLC